MNKKQQFIEKCSKEFEDKFTFGGRTGVVAFNREVYPVEINKFLQSKLSECWDMAGEAVIDKLDLEIEAWMGANENLDREFTTNEMMKHLRKTTLTSKQEGKECENCGTDTEQHTCVNCEQDIPSYICEEYKGMCPHCSWLIGK